MRPKLIAYSARSGKFDQAIAVATEAMHNLDVNVFEYCESDKYGNIFFLPHIIISASNAYTSLEAKKSIEAILQILIEPLSKIGNQPDQQSRDFFEAAQFCLNGGRARNATPLLLQALNSNNSRLGLMLAETPLLAVDQETHRGALLYHFLALINKDNFKEYFQYANRLIDCAIQQQDPSIYNFRNESNTILQILLELRNYPHLSKKIKAKILKEAHALIGKLLEPLAKQNGSNSKFLTAIKECLNARNGKKGDEKTLLVLAIGKHPNIVELLIDEYEQHITAFDIATNKYDSDAYLEVIALQETNNKQQRITYEKAHKCLKEICKAAKALRLQQAQKLELVTKAKGSYGYLSSALKGETSSTDSLGDLPQGSLPNSRTVSPADSYDILPKLPAGAPPIKELKFDTSSGASNEPSPEPSPERSDNPGLFKQLMH